MTEKICSLRLADELAGDQLYGLQRRCRDEAAAHIRRLVAENEAKDALLRQALDALGGYASSIQLKHHQDAGEKAITAIRQHLGQKGETQ